MLGRLRPIALLIRRVSKIPEAPTRVPATMSRFEPSVKPDAATARPVKELSREINTGTSAPPIGNTKAAPSTKARASKIHSSDVVPLTRSSTMTTAEPRPMRAFINF